MNVNKKSLVIFGILSLFIGSILIINHGVRNGFSLDFNLEKESVPFESPYTSASSNQELIEEIIESKLSNFSEKGYFPHLYEASLQSIYFALYTLDSINRLYTINESKMTNFIMSYYSDEEELFIDNYAERYLDTNFTLYYYPLNTLLEVNCYAILALHILDQLDLINSADMIEYIWSCYQPVSSGFIGQPYNAALEPEFKIATMDNTYYAVKTLNILLSNWDSYQTEVNEIIIFINSLQKLGTHCGFKNDLEDGFYSLELFPQTEPTLYSSYYCIKTLEIFGPGALTSIRVNDFKAYLGELYDEELHYFDFTTNSYHKILNITIVPSALGLELAEIYSFSNISYSSVLAFILNQRSSAGGWGSSTANSYYELIDTFQVIYCLKELDEIAQFSTEAKDQIVEHLKLYSTFRGFAPLSQEYMSSTLFNDIISILSYYNHILEFDLESFYTSLKRSIFYSSSDCCQRFYSLTCLEYIEIFEGTIYFRSFPIEYNTQGTHNLVNKLNYMYNWRSAFEILSTFQKIYKLEDYAVECDFSNLISKITNAQFLDNTPQFSAFYGGFLPYPYCLNYEPELQVKYIDLEQSYYALRTLELLNDYLSLGELRNIGIDVNAFGTHIARHIVETPSELYFNPIYSDDLDSILENTYYMVELLLKLDEFSLPIQKIENFITNNLNYSNMRNIYFTYKISEVLDLGLEFDLNQTQNLVESLYSEEYHEFYPTTEKKEIDQRIFYYICELAKFSNMNVKGSVPDVVALGDSFDISVELGNLIVKDYGEYTSIRLESSQLGTFVLDRLDNNTYSKSDIFISVATKNYPVIIGNITIYEGVTLRSSYPFTIATTYEVLTELSKHELSNGIRITVEGSFVFGTEIEPLYESEVYCIIHRNGEEIGNVIFSSTDSTTYTNFLLEYKPSQGGDYRFDVYLDEKFQEDDRYLGQISYTHLTSNPDGSEAPPYYHAEILSSIPLIVGLIGAPLGIMAFTSRDKLKKMLKLSSKANSKQ